MAAKFGRILPFLFGGVLLLGWSLHKKHQRRRALQHWREYQEGLVSQMEHATVARRVRGFSPMPDSALEQDRLFSSAS